MRTTFLEKNLQILTNNFDQNTKKAGNLLREISRDAVTTKALNEDQINQALAEVCQEAKPVAQTVVSLIKAQSNQ